MSLLPWTGPTEEVHAVRLVYPSGETRLVRWMRQWDVDQLSLLIAEAHDLETKRSALLASYLAAGATEHHPDVAYLIRVDNRKRVYSIMTWGIATKFFSVPCREGIRTTGVCPYDLSRIEIIESRTVIAES